MSIISGENVLEIDVLVPNNNALLSITCPMTSNFDVIDDTRNSLGVAVHIAGKSYMAKQNCRFIYL